MSLRRISSITHTLGHLCQTVGQDCLPSCCVVTVQSSWKVAPVLCDVDFKTNPKIPCFDDFVGLKPTFSKLQWWNLAVRTRDFFPTSNFEKNGVKGIRHLWAHFCEKFPIWTVLSCLSPYFYRNDVEVWIKRTDQGISERERTEIFRQSRSRDCAACQYCIAFWFLIFYIVF